MSNRFKIVLLFLFLYVFRVAFGLSQPFFSTDESQTYLIGLKCFTTGTWPYFGPDIFWLEKNFESQIPGALEGLLIGLPFHVFPVPEAPFLLLNLLSLASLGLLSWYIARRLPEIPFAFILTWLALLPWNLHESTNIINPSYLIVGSVLFFVGFLESLPGFTLQKLSPRMAFALMGFGLFWDMQFHYSWVLLPPFILGAFFWRWRRKELKGLPEIAGLVLGAAIPLLFIIPTFLKYGIRQEAGGMGLATAFNWENFKAIYLVLPRYLSLVCYEMPRFLGGGTHWRLQFLLQDAPWVMVPGFFLWLVGYAQPFAFLIWGWFKDPRHPEAKGIQTITFLGIFLVWASFCFNAKGPAAVSYYILLPLIAVGSFYIWSRFAPYRGWRRFGMACIIASLWFQTGYLAWQMTNQSLYLDRAKLVKAIQERDYHIFGERRTGSLY
jgi:hypothetical protein